MADRFSVAVSHKSLGSAVTYDELIGERSEHDAIITINLPGRGRRKA